MNHDEFIKMCKGVIADEYNELHHEDGHRIGADDVYVPWSCKTLQNSKAMMATTVPDGKYYECTMNGDKGEIYIDTYLKVGNEVVYD